MSKVLKISRSGYYKFVRSKPSKRSQDTECLKEKIKAIHEASKHMEPHVFMQNCWKMARIARVKG